MKRFGRTGITEYMRSQLATAPVFIIVLGIAFLFSDLGILFAPGPFPSWWTLLFIALGALLRVRRLR